MLRAVRRGVPAIQEQMEINVADLLSTRHRDDRLHVALVAVHAAVTQEAQEMQPAALLFGLPQGV